jgi:uncharacterized protein (DUF1330 family)
MPFIEPSPDQLQQLIASAGDGQPVVMINLLRFRDRAEYPAGYDAEPCSGQEAYQRYGMYVLPMLAEAGGKILWMGNATQTVIGPEAESWDEAILVQYPSRAAFLSMVTRPDYVKISVHRSAALEDSRLIATATGTTELPA